MRKIKGLITLVFMFILLSIIVAADDYHWECLHKGDSLIRFTCNYGCCVVCVKDGYSRLFSYCSDAVYCSCLGGGDPDLVPPDVTINAPRNGYVSSSRLVPLDIFVSEPSRLFNLDSQREKYGYKELCSDCQVYKRSMSFDEGFHVLTLKAIDGSGNVGYRTTFFTVDSIKPNVKKTSPRNGEYANGTFTVEYDEINLMNITLHYKENGTEYYKNIIKKNCPPGNSRACSFNVNSLAQGELQYYFTVTDLATSVDSKNVNVYVDTVAPEILNYSTKTYYSDMSVNLGIVVSEKSKIEYIDYSDTVPRYKIICSDCMSFNKPKSFVDGNHSLTIRATDGAGNKDDVSIKFVVDSKKPVIKTVTPVSNSYTNGSFKVKYDEQNLKNITLMYKENGSVSYTSKTKHDCPSGKNQECTIEVSGLKQGELWYYFIVEDRAFRDESRKVRVFVDTVKPVITLKNAVGTFERYYHFNLSVSEKVKLEYQDNSEGYPRYKSLCLKCDMYTTKKYFKSGEHSLNVRATDNAGNSDEKSFSFTII